MGCDIHTFVEKRNKETNQWEFVKDDVFSLDDYDKEYFKKEKSSEIFGWRSYRMFSILNNVRNNYGIIPMYDTDRGFPDDISKEVKMEYDSYSNHSESYLTAKELTDFDYDKKATENESYRDCLGDFFFKHLEELKSLGDPDEIRVVFWFDN